MSSYAGLYINDKEVFSFRNEVNPDLFFLFDKSELVSLKGKDAIEYTKGIYTYPEDLDADDIEAVEVHSYETSAKVLKNRLHILGIGRQLLERVFTEESSDEIERLERYIKSDSWKSMKATLKDDLKRAKALTFEKWLLDIQKHVNNPSKPEVGYNFRNGPLEKLDYSNERIVLRAVLEVIPDDTKIVLDVSELFEDGWSNEEVDVEIPSAKQISWELDSSPPIILTEGVFDRKVINESITLLYPHLANYFKFLDTDLKTEGGAGAVVKLLKSFAAAGVSNRILAVFDNDTAAREALEGLKRFKLPANFKTMLYPSLELAESYPTIGPQGSAEMNVNGLAASIELYLGSDVLYQDDGLFTPVQWTGYSSKMSSYQGEVLKKKQIQDLFLTKVKIAKGDKTIIQGQDWSGVKLIIDSMIHELGTF